MEFIILGDVGLYIEIAIFSSIIIFQIGACTRKITKAIRGRRSDD